MVTTQWLPFYALYLLKTLREPKLKNAVLAGLFFAMAALAEMIFASFLALFTAIVVLAVWRPWRLRWNALGRLALAMAVAGLIWAPVLVPIAREFLTGDYALTGWGESVKLSADVVGLVTPTELNPIARPARLFRDAGAAQTDSWTAALRAVEEGKGRFSDINTVFLGYVTLALALFGAWVGRRRLRPWIWTRAGLRRVGAGSAPADQRPLPVQPGQPAARGRHVPAAVHPAALHPVHQRQPRAQPQQRRS